MINTSTTSGMLSNAKVYVSTVLCVLWTPEGNIFGAVSSENGLHLDLHKVDEIKLLFSPKNVAKFQRVLGIIICMAPFISHLSDLRAFLTEL